MHTLLKWMVVFLAFALIGWLAGRATLSEYPSLRVYPPSSIDSRP